MWKTILRRILLMIPQLIVLSLLVFIFAKMMPGDALTGMITPQTDPSQIEHLRRVYGFYNPWYVQYWDWVTKAIRGDFGTSFQQQVPVTQIIGQRAENTAWLSLLTVIFTYALAIPLGVIAGRHQDEWQDQAVQVFNYFTYAVQAFVFFLLGIWLFGYLLNWFPTTGSVSTNSEPGTIGYIFDRLDHMLLPALLSAVISTTGTVQYLRTGIVDNKVEDYVKMARSKGVPERVVFNKHILRNSLLPIAAFMGNVITGLFSGSVVVEQIFGYPGIGQLFYTSVQSRDSTVMTALILLFGVLTLIGNLLSDIIMSIIDPRIRIE